MEKINSELRKGAWTQEEDNLLRACIHQYGEGKWHLVPQRAGLKRCRKSCRIRWLNYLKPDINRGNFTEDEVDMIRRFHKLLGNRWSLIAGRLPGRTTNDVKNFWHTKMSNKTEENQKKKKAKEVMSIIPEETAKVTRHVIIKPRPHTFSKNSPWLRKNNKLVSACESVGAGGASTSSTGGSFAQPCPRADLSKSESDEWWESLLKKEGDEGQNGISMMEFFDQDFLKMEGPHNWWSHFL